MKNNSLLITLVVALAFGVVGFFGGMQYQKSKLSTGFSRTGQQVKSNFVQQGSGNQGRTSMGGRPVSGEIISADENSITVKMQDGSTKIITYSDSTKVSKTSDGSVSDLSVGEQITVMGSESTQGTITAQSIFVGSGMFQGQPLVGSSSEAGQKPVN